GILDAGMLATDADVVGAAIEGTAAPGAVAGDDGSAPSDVLVAAADGVLLGACLVLGEEIDAIAVRPGRRGQGIGTALVEAAADRRERLVVAFEPDVRDFWASLDFELEPVADGERIRGVRRT
ncbi:MAG: GNAT family N-acetyltransferase, partial [Haloarculaceae archaeon]